MLRTRKPGPIFRELQEQNAARLSAEDYQQLWAVLRKLGYKDFKSREQGLITLKFLKGENIFGVLPTAGGKSLTFQMVARLTDGLTIVITPLIALMKDQVGKHRDGASVYFNSDLTPYQKREVKRRIREGKVRLLYISPERLKSADFKELLASSRQRVKRFVIDEAHCVFEWGYGFRVKYLHIGKEIQAFEKQLPKGHRIPVLLLTATASPWLQRETAKNLGVHITAANYITRGDGADRPELKISLRAARDNSAKIRWLAKQLNKGGRFYGKRGIIFSAFADGGDGLGAFNATKICEKLADLGIKRIDTYHGGMGPDDRRIVQKQFENKELRVLVATKAFGMGLDLPKLDFIIHFYPPLSLEEYWQEAGRGGRGMRADKGEYCQCIVLHSDGDYQVLQGFPNLASFVKTLSTFTSATRGEVCFAADAIAPNGRLRQMLDGLQARKDIRRLKPLRIGGRTLECWKLAKPASRVLKHVDQQIEAGLKAKQTKRLRSYIRLRVKRKGKVIRVPHGHNWDEPNLSYYAQELNWFTEPDIAALDLIDDEWNNGVLYTRFRVLRDDLNRKDILRLRRKINAFRDEGKGKLNEVFDEFLPAKRGTAKSVVLRYLKLDKKPVYPATEE